MGKWFGCKSYLRRSFGRLLSPVSAALLTIASAHLCPGQLTTGILDGIVLGARNQPEAAVSITISGSPGRVFAARSDGSGRFRVVLPYGNYRVSAAGRPEANVHISPLTTTHLTLTVGQPATVETAAIRPDRYPGPFTLGGLLLALEPAAITEPLDFSGLASMRIPLVSERAYSWTDVSYAYQGMNATDPYQPGRTVAFPDVQAISDVVVRSGFDLGASRAYGSEIAAFLREPAPGFHGDVFTSNTGSPFASENLSQAAVRAGLRQSEHFRWFTRDTVQAGASLWNRADVFASATGQWAAQAVPPAKSGDDLSSRLLFANARGRVRVSRLDLVEGQFSGSRIDLSDRGMPAGLEALAGRRMSPSLSAALWGFAGLEESDHLDFVQAGWTRQTGGAERAGALQVRYSYSTAHLDTNPADGATNTSRIDVASGAVSGAPPLANMAVRTGHSLEAAFTPGEIGKFGRRHQLAMGGGWEIANFRNRFTAPSDSNIITVNGAPAFLLELNTPLHSRGRIRNAFGHLEDRVAIAKWLSVQASAVGDYTSGSLPSQSSPPGRFAPERRFDSRAGVITWTSVSPRAGITLAPPFPNRMVLRAGYARLNSPLAGRYLDFANPNSLGGTLRRAGEGSAAAVATFGGPFATIDPKLKRPYADEFNLGARLSLPFRAHFAVQFFRRDEKDRIAAVNRGVPESAFHPAQVVDPGPDGVVGTFDDQQIIAFAQDASTLGNDRYLLTNPPGLRMLYKGLIAELNVQRRFAEAHASFMAVRTYGPANPGNSVIENDPGVIGALFADPNAAIHASGRGFFDRAYAGKLRWTAQLPKSLGRIEWTNTVDYMDGLVFGRRLLVTGLPQGPFLLAATVRGSPEGGNRAEYVLNWNLRLSRTFRMLRGTARLALDIINVANASSRLAESDVTGPLFNERLPLAIQPPRFVRFSVGFGF